MRRIGIGYRTPLAHWIHACPDEIQCLEITAEHFFDEPHALKKLRGLYPLMLHGLGLSLGTPGPMDPVYLQKFAQVCQQADPLWISEHIAFTRTREVDLGHLNPVSYTDATLQTFIEHVQQLRQVCQKPVLLENITSHIRPFGDYSETEFINLLCERSGARLLLDVTNLYVNSKNHGYDAMSWLAEIQADYIQQLHVVGYHLRDGQYFDTHGEAIQPEIFTLIERVIEYSAVQTVILERDQNFPDIAQLRGELTRLESCFELH